MDAVIDTSTRDMAEALQASADDNLQQFLAKWDAEYRKKVNSIPLFDGNTPSQYTDSQKEFFVRTFYHVRGHFHKFLWMLGNTAPDKETKAKILHNIEEEFGGDSPSHEQLYFEFAKSLGLEVADEFLTEKHNLPFIREFNLRHLQWLQNSDWAGKWAVFSAYERLDNIDYANLLDVARRFGATDRGLIFFIIHNKADHFEHTYQNLAKIWRSDQAKVREAFSFIGEHQIKMWQILSETITNE